MTGPGRRDEDGIVIPLVSLLMVSLLVVTAIVVDKGLTRTVRRDARLVADAAATAGALDLGNATSVAGCIAALQYAYTNLELSYPSNLTSACTSTMAATCTTTTGARTVTTANGRTTVKVTHPVPDGHRLLRPTVIGGGTSQLAASTDNARCARLAVEITRPQTRIFGGIVSNADEIFNVHSVAAYDTGGAGSTGFPAVVALHPTRCRSYDSGNGNIHVGTDTTAVYAGLIVSDSNGSACTSGNAIIHSSSNGRIHAACLGAGCESTPPAAGTQPGKLQWFQAPASTGFLTSSSAVTSALTGGSTNYVGERSATTARTTNVKMWERYRCSAVTPTLCTTAADPLYTSLGSNPASLTPPSYLALNAAPIGWTTYNTCTLPATLLGTNVFVNCTGTTITAPPQVDWLPLSLTSTEPTMILNKPLSITSGARFFINATPATGTTAVNPTMQPLVVIKGDLFMQGGQSLFSAAQTTVVTSGRIWLQSGPTVRWTPPASGLRRGLLFWTTSSTTTSPVELNGGPSFTASGSFYAGGPTVGSSGIPLLLSGGGSIDLSRVQLWVDSVAISGGATVTLRADPATNTSIGTPVSRLIR